jgi:DNA-binding ferritin-like protein (Dps family)
MSKYRRLEKRVKKLEEELTEDIKEIDGALLPKT